MLFHYVTAQEVAEVIRKDGTMTTDERGLPRKHPLLQVLRENSQSFKAYAAEFGLTPSARARLNLQGGKDDFDQFEADFPDRDEVRLPRWA